MKKILFGLVLLLLFFIGKNVYANSGTYFKWIKTEIEVPLYSRIDDYINKYELEFYLDGKLSEDYVVRTQVDSTTFSVITTYIIGRYYVRYEAYYSDTIRSKQDICFIVCDKEAPVIDGPNKITVEYGKSLQLEDYFDINDNYNYYEELIIDFDLDSVNLATLGKYDASIIAKDESNNKTEKNIVIEIVDTKPPTISVIKELIFSYNVLPNINEYIKVSDNYDLNLTIEIVSIKNDIIGQSTVTVLAKDSSLNKTQQTFVCRIIDDIYPTITLTKEEDTVDIDTVSNINELLYSYIVDYSDNYSKKENLILEIETDLQEIAVGFYEVKYIVTDEFANSKEASLYLQLLEEKGPVINAEESYVFNKGENVDLLSLVSASDEYDNSVNEKLEVVDTNFNAFETGTYYVYYRVFNNSGKYTIAKIEIKVIENNNTSDTQVSNETFTFSSNYILLIIIVLESIIFMIILLKRKKPSSK